jgi:hypothetical protein
MFLRPGENPFKFRSSMSREYFWEASASLKLGQFFSQRFRARNRRRIGVLQIPEK